MAGSKPAALPLGYTPAFILARHAAPRSRRAGVPVVDSQAQAQVAVLEIDPARHEQRRASVGFRRRELVARERDSPEPLLEGREGAVAPWLRRCVERGIGKAEQPRVQAADRQPPA